MSDIVERLAHVAVWCQSNHLPLFANTAAEAKAEIERLRDENERLRAALKPFSMASESYDDEPPARVIASKRGCILSVCDLRAAKAALGWEQIWTR